MCLFIWKMCGKLQYQMQWEFRKALESFEGYKRTTSFKNEIENGDDNTLDMVAREVELILADKAEKIIPKVLALRFVRDIMVLGQEDIVKRCEKLVPQLTKICSYELNSTDPDRGQTYFHDHPAYLKLTDEEEKKQIDTLGSTYLILSLESICHWAKWIPIDSTGQESIYSKAYNTLIDRGVKFPTSFHYYKQSDTEKFKNMYKMEFFTDSFDSAYSQSPSEVQPSQISEDRESKASWNKRSHVKEDKKVVNSQGVVEEYTGETRRLRTVSEIMGYLNELRRSKGRKMGDLRQIHKKVQQMYEGNSKSKLGKEERRWVETYIINFSLLTSNVIDYDEFLQRSLSEEVELEAVQQEDLSIDKEVKFTQIKLNTHNKTPGEVSKINRLVESKVGDKPDELLKRQEYEFKAKINSLMLELEQKNSEIAIIKSNSDKDRAKMIEDYESRIGLIKNEVKKGQQDRGAFQKELEKENDRLKAKIVVIQEQLLSNNYNTARERDIESERNQLLTKVKRLELQNEKLSQAKSTKGTIEKEVNVLETTVKEKDAVIDRLRAELKKAEKQAQNYHDEAGLYKSELINERTKHQQKLIAITRSNDNFDNQNKTLKEKMLELRKTLDLKEIETLNLKEELRRFQGKVRDLNEKRSANDQDNNKSDHWLKSRTAVGLQSPAKLYSPNNVANAQGIDAYNGHIYTNDKKLRFNNYEDLYSELRPNNKELFIRLCRCALKKKDILFKENQLEIGIISQLVSESKIKFILHFTNTSEKQIQNLKIQYNISQSYVSTLHYQIDNKYIFCIQPQEQQKVNVVITNQEPPFLKERAIIEVSYEKHGSFFTNNIFLPFIIVKFFDFYKPKPFKLSERPKNLREVMQIKYNKKMLPKANSIKSYFDEAEEVSPNKFQMEAYHRETDLTIRLAFIVSAETESMILEAVVMREKVNERQRYIFEELVSFVQTAFKK